jgi:hypothetical protein
VSAVPSKSRRIQLRLSVTGAEALYANMGHFGAKRMRLAWLAIAFPSLVFKQRRCAWRCRVQSHRDSPRLQFKISQCNQKDGQD